MDEPGSRLCENVPTGMADDEDDDHKFDLEVATVLSQGVCNSITQPQTKSYTCAPAKLSYSPFRPSTALTNITRGNFRTNTPQNIVSVTLSLHQMAAQGELLLLKQELKSYDVNTREGHGFTALVYAAAYNQFRTIDFLLCVGCDPNLYGVEGETPLHFASANGFDRSAAILLAGGADVNQTSQNGCSALLYAAHQGHVECVEALLEWGADVTATDPKGYTALQIAVLHGNKNVQVAIERHLLSLLENTFL